MFDKIVMDTIENLPSDTDFLAMDSEELRGLLEPSLKKAGLSYDRNEVLHAIMW